MTVDASTPNPGGDWPLLRLTLPATADDESIALLTQTAVDAGALGGALENGTLALYLPQSADAPLAEALHQALTVQIDAFGWPATALQPETLPDAPWATAWKDRFQTFAIGQRLLIRPDWEQGTPAPAGMEARLPIWLRPGQGFGTGHHETTRLALTMLERSLQPSDTVLDFGTGSGILAIAAVLLGARQVCGVDFDPQALINAYDNLKINGIQEQIVIYQNNRPPKEAGAFSLIVCNMLPQNALHLLPELAARLSGANPRLIYTGFLTDQENEVRDSLFQAGLRPVEIHSEGMWGGVMAVPA